MGLPLRFETFSRPKRRALLGNRFPGRSQGQVRAFVGVLTKRNTIGLETPDTAVVGPGDALEGYVLERRAG